MIWVDRKWFVGYGLDFRLHKCCVTVKNTHAKLQLCFSIWLRAVAFTYNLIRMKENGPWIKKKSRNGCFYPADLTCKAPEHTSTRAATEINRRWWLNKISQLWQLAQRFSEERTSAKTFSVFCVRQNRLELDGFNMKYLWVTSAFSPHRAVAQQHDESFGGMFHHLMNAEANSDIPDRSNC